MEHGDNVNFAKKYINELFDLYMFKYDSKNNTYNSLLDGTYKVIKPTCNIRTVKKVELESKEKLFGLMKDKRVGVAVVTFSPFPSFIANLF
jgi:hypothetical protein